MNKFIYIFFVLCFTFSNTFYAFGGSVWQNVALLLFLIMVLSKGVDKLEFSVVYFVLCCAMSIVMNDIPLFFKPGERFVQYLLLLFSVSPLIRGEGIDIMRLKMMEIVVISLSLITIGSFVLYLTGGGETHVGYMGFSQHPNFLGFFSMISAISLFVLFFLTDSIKYKFFIGTLFVASIVTVMLSAARICLVGSALGCLVFLYLNFKKSLSKLLLSIFFIIGVGIATFPLYESYLEGIMYKQNAAKESESSTSSRDRIWATRLEEINKYPVFGIGCFAVDTSIPVDDDERFFNPYVTATGSVELGSTYLGVFSQTGFLGAVGFVAIMLLAFYRCVKTERCSDEIIPKYLIALFAGVAVHMIVEGYATTAGSMQCLFLWLLLSCMMIPSDIMAEEVCDIRERFHVYDEEDDEESYDESN